MYGDASRAVISGSRDAKQNYANAASLCQSAFLGSEGRSRSRETMSLGASDATETKIKKELAAVRAGPPPQPRGETKERLGIDGLRLGTARPFPLWRLRSDLVRRPSIQNIRERHSDHVPPGPNTWTLNIQAAWSVPHPGTFC